MSHKVKHLAAVRRSYLINIDSNGARAGSAGVWLRNISRQVGNVSKWGKNEEAFQIFAFFVTANKKDNNKSKRRRGESEGEKEI